MQVSKLLPMALLGAIAAGPLMSLPAQAESQRICIVDDDSRQVFCGRTATRDEIRRSGLGRGRFGQGRGRFDDARFDNDRRFDDDRFGRRNSRISRRQEARIRDLLDDLYRDVLGRKIDDGGFNTYLDRIVNDGWDLNRVRRDLADSREARDRLNDLYRAVLKRDIDSGGLRTYRRLLGDDWSLEDVKRDLLDSDEARRLKRRK